MGFSVWSPKAFEGLHSSHSIGGGGAKSPVAHWLDHQQQKICDRFQLSRLELSFNLQSTLSTFSITLTACPMTLFRSDNITA